MAAESALALESAFDDALDFTAPHANVVQLAITQSLKLQHCLALDAPLQIGHPPRLQPGDQLVRCVATLCSRAVVLESVLMTFSGIVSF